MLRKTVQDVTQRARKSQALKQITATHERLPFSPSLNVSCVLWTADRKYKPAASKQAPVESFQDPFAKENLDQDLFITQLHGTHNLVLNKFSIVDEHVVLATVDLAPQEEPLDAADFRAMWTAMQELDTFAFFNCGVESGASQPHKHMQLMTYRSMKDIMGLDTPSLLYFIDQQLRAHSMSQTVQLPELPFCHFLHRIDVADGTDSEKAAADVVAIYDKVLRQMNSTASLKTSAQSGTSSSLFVSYNLLLTSSFLFMIPRKTEGFNGIEVNSIGFIGSFFVYNDKQHAYLTAHDGIVDLLRQVTFPPAQAEQ
uniref:ATP adenylyltransferase n=1 Tax=Peronospora matthiolae TaxID=2874970 RepID=A0AAV1UWP3_9STRA